MEDEDLFSLWQSPAGAGDLRLSSAPPPLGMVHALQVPGLCPVCSVMCFLLPVCCYNCAAWSHTTQTVKHGTVISWGRECFVKSIKGEAGGWERGGGDRKMWEKFFRSLEGSAPRLPHLWHGTCPHVQTPNLKCTFHRGGWGSCSREGVRHCVRHAADKGLGTTQWDSEQRPFQLHNTSKLSTHLCTWLSLPTFSICH